MSLWQVTSVDRTEDMGTVKRLKVTEQGDGDLIVSIVTGRGMPLYDRDEKLDATAEFCVSGGHSPRTLKALRAVMVAMREDEAERADFHRPAGSI